MLFFQVDRVQSILLRLSRRFILPDSTVHSHTIFRHYESKTSVLTLPNDCDNKTFIKWLGRELTLQERTKYDQIITQWLNSVAQEEIVQEAKHRQETLFVNKPAELPFQYDASTFSSSPLNFHLYYNCHRGPDTLVEPDATYFSTIYSQQTKSEVVERVNYMLTNAAISKGDIAEVRRHINKLLQY